MTRPRIVLALVACAVIAAVMSPTPDAGSKRPPHPPKPTTTTTSTTVATTTTVPTSGWRTIFTDGFTTSTVPGPTWGAYPDGWPDTSGHGTYTPSAMSVHDGVLDIHLRTVDGRVTVAAPYPLLPVPVVQQYGQPFTPLAAGRYTVTFRTDPLPGYKLAWLLWPMSDVWPRDGEIDFPEGDLDKTIAGYVHHQGATTGTDQDAFPTSATFTSWHTATIEWVPGRVTFTLDGQVIGTTTTRVPSTPMRWVLQTETDLSLVAPAPSVDGHVLIDSVTVEVPT